MLNSTFKKFIILSVSSILFLSGCNIEQKLAENQETKATENANTPEISDLYEYEAFDPDEAVDRYGNILSEYSLTKNSQGGLIEYKLDGYAYLTTADENNSSDSQQSSFSLTDIGSKIGNLTLTKASVTYSYRQDKYCIADNSAAFDGTITLKGNIRININGDVNIQPGEITFQAAEGEWNGLPVIWSGDYFDENGKLCSVISAPPFLSLGMTEDYELDTSLIPDDGSFKEVEITITELSLSGIDPNRASSKSSARLLEIKEA